MPPISSRLTIMNGITMRDRTAFSVPSILGIGFCMPNRSPCGVTILE